MRWCPGCGDYAVLAAVQGFLPELGLRRENIVFVSGIGCSSRFPYYLDTYGMHSIHGRAPAIATGLATAREDLSVWVVTGDGDALSHRRQPPDPRPAPQREPHDPAVQQPDLRPDQGAVLPHLRDRQGHQVDAARLAGPALQPGLARPRAPRRTFVARTVDSDRKHLTEVLRAAAAHRGTALVEIYQNCPIFNDGAFDAIKGARTPRPRTRSSRCATVSRSRSASPTRTATRRAWSATAPPAG